MISGKLYGITFEGGYLYRGVPQSHKPYIAAHGHLFADWYLAASCDIPHEDPDEDAFKESLAFSGGLFGIQGTIRASLVFYNTMEEVDRLAEGLKKAMEMLS